MSRLRALWESSVGKKAVMAVTGLIMVAYLITHVLANLLIFLTLSPKAELAEVNAERNFVGLHRSTSTVVKLSALFGLDSFAGGFIGYLAKTGDLSEQNLRRAVVYGSAMGSFAVEKFSVQRLLEITPEDIRRRVSDIHRLVNFEQEL